MLKGERSRRERDKPLAASHQRPPRIDPSSPNPPSPVSGSPRNTAANGSSRTPRCRWFPPPAAHTSGQGESRQPQQGGGGRRGVRAADTHICFTSSRAGAASRQGDLHAAALPPSASGARRGAGGGGASLIPSAVLSASFCCPLPPALPFAALQRHKAQLPAVPRCHEMHQVEIQSPRCVCGRTLWQLLRNFL